MNQPAGPTWSPIRDANTTCTAEAAKPENDPSGGMDGVLVLGMHRSGTSLVAGSLHLLGLATCVPEDLMTGMPWNPAGHWESRSLSRLDDRLLDEMGRAWWYPPPSGAAYTDVTSRLFTAPESAVDLFRRTYASTPWVWKDPRLCLLLPFWREAFGEVVAAVVVHREPHEVARSLELRNGFPMPFGMALWVRYNRLLLEHCRGLAVLLVRYDDLVGDPGGWIDAAADFVGTLGMAVRPGAEADIGKFVRPTLRHLGADPSSDRPPRATPTGAEAGGPELALEVEQLVAALGSLEGRHLSFEPPSLDPEAPVVEAQLSGRWPGHPPAWNDPPWRT